MESTQLKKDVIDGVYFNIDSNVHIEVSKSNLELIMSGLRLSKEAKRELGARLIIENHVLNQAQINQITQDIENINKMIKEYGNMLYGGILE